MLVNGIRVLLRHLNIIFRPILFLITVLYLKGITGLQPQKYVHYSLLNSVLLLFYNHTY